MRVTSVRVEPTRLGASIKRALLAGDSGGPVVTTRSRELKDYVDGLQTESAAVARGYYDALLSTVEHILERPGVRSISSSGSKRRAVNVVIEIPGRRNKAIGFTLVPPVPWEALSKSYREKWPKSEQFWRKQGILYERFSSWRAGAKRVGRLSSYTRPARMKRVPGKGVQVEFLTTFPPLHEYLNDILREPFVTQNHPALHYVPFPRGSGARRTLLRIRFPENDRPWLRKLAILMGAGMRKDLALIGKRRR